MDHYKRSVSVIPLQHRTILFAFSCLAGPTRWVNCLVPRWH